MKQECGREMRILPHTSFVYCSSTPNLPFFELNMCCTSEMSRATTGVRERDLTLRGDLFIGRSKTDVPFYIGWSLSPYPSEDIYI